MHRLYTVKQTPHNNGRHIKHRERMWSVFCLILTHNRALSRRGEAFDPLVVWTQYIYCQLKRYDTYILLPLPPGKISTWSGAQCSKYCNLHTTLSSPNSSSNAMTTSTESRLSKPRSFIKWASSVTWSGCGKQYINGARRCTLANLCRINFIK